MGVVAINPQTGSSRLLASGGFLGTPYGIAIGPGAEIYVANGASVVSINPVTGAQL